MGRVAYGWFYPYAALHDIFFTKLKFRRLKWSNKLKVVRFLLLFTLLGVVATIEIFWEWGFPYMVLQDILHFSNCLGFIFRPRDWCRYVCILGAYAQIFSKIRILGIKVDKDLCLRCKQCKCDENYLINVDWKMMKRTWMTPDYCVICLNCVNSCRSGAVYTGEFIERNVLKG